MLCLYNEDTLNICMKVFGLEKIIFDKMTAVITHDNFSLIRLLYTIDGAFMGRSTPTTAFDGAI